MKKTIVFLFGLLMTTALHATIKIDSGKKYYFVCDLWESGSMVLGANHEVAPFIYYDSASGQLHADSYWVIAEDGNGYYTICNAQSKQYLVAVDGRLTDNNGNYTAKGLQLRNTVTDDTGRWIFRENSNGAVYILNADNNSMGINIRTDGTNLVGTYPFGGTSNELFHIYDEQGKSITDNTSTGGDTETTITGLSGKTPDGEYWERTGLVMPVVLTTDTKRPVLYKIRNVRSGMYAVENNGELYQSSNSSTSFYFIEANNCINIYSEDGKYVSTDFYRSGNGRTPLRLYAGDTKGTNIWDFSYYNSGTQYSGYAICKQDNLPEEGSTEIWAQSSYLFWNDYNLGDKNVIGLYNCDEGSTFVFCSSDNRHLEHLLENGITFDGTVISSFKSCIDSLRLNDKDLVYDQKNKNYMFSLPESLRGGQTFTGSVYLKLKPTIPTGTRILINGQQPDENNNITITDVSCAEPYNLSLINEDNEEIASSTLSFTFLPIVEVNVPSCSGSIYTTGTIRVNDGGTAGYDSTFVAAYRYRGASAQNYAKKSYAIKLRDENGNSVDREFFGLRDDNNWILDAMAVDRSCMRNRVSTDLWNDFATKPYHRREGWETKARTGTRGRFVEVFLNGSYHGLYCMTEKMDRKQLKLKKYVAATETEPAVIHGSLYKSSQWNYEVLMGHEIDSEYFPKRAPASYNNNLRQETWRDYEVKYPDYEEEKIDWGPLWNAINFVATSSDVEFDNKFDTYFDRPVINDYYLFIELMLATDNHGKNMFFFNYDQQGEKYAEKIGITPWDLDGTWGRRWDGSRSYTQAEQDFTTFLWSYEHGTHTIFHRLAKSTYRIWRNALIERYAQLRQTYFDEDRLIERFTNYAGLFSESHADQREQNRWSSLHNDIGGDVDYITDWIRTRLAYLDDQYEYTKPETPEGIISVENSHIGISGGKGAIAISVSHPTPLRIYNVGGTLVRTVDVTDNFTVIEGFTPGIYIVAGKKVVVR